MLNAVPAALRVAARAMVTRHPNSLECQVWRKTVTRTAGAESGSMGGLPTLGGIGVLDPEEEVEADYAMIGEGHMLGCGVYEPTEMVDNKDSAEQAPVFQALLEPATEGAWQPKDSDLVMVMPGGGVVLTYEVTKVLNAVNIPPYVPKVELSAIGDLMYIPGVAAAVAARS